MAESIETTQNEPQNPEFDDAGPSGGHALEVAARAGFGPLSPLAQEVWHGQSAPCVSCGQLVHRDDAACEQCGQDLSEEMIQKMRQHAGPWFVLEHVRPFPGVSLERVIRQVRRGLITETSIVRGPSNDYQWRFAVETPGLCRYFGKCWCCHGDVSLSDAYCPHCLHYLSFEKPRPTLQVPGGTEARPADAAQHVPAVAPAHRPVLQPGPSTLPPRTSTAQVGPRPSVVAPPPPSQPAPRPNVSPDLARLSAAVRQARAVHMDSEGEAPARVAGVNVGWIAALIIAAAVVALLLISRARSERSTGPTTPSLPTMQPAPIAMPRPATTGAATSPSPAPPSPIGPTTAATAPVSTPATEKAIPPPATPSP